VKRLISYFSSFDRWLFGKGGAETLGLLRIVFGAIAFCVLVIQLPFLLDYYGDRGLLPREALKLWQWRWLPEPLSNLTNFQMQLLFCLVMLSAVTTTLGLFTRFSTIVLFVGIMFFHNRNPLILNSGDTLLRLVLLYLAISSCGMSYSLDRWRAQKAGRFKLKEISLLPQRLIQIQIALVYFSAIWHKAQGPLWREGTVTWYVSRLEELHRFSLPPFLMTETAAFLSTWGTLAVQLAFCTLVWFKPYRNLVLFAGLMLHLGIEYAMNIPFFGLITVSCYLAFFRPEEVRGFIAKLSSDKDAPVKPQAD